MNKPGLLLAVETINESAKQFRRKADELEKLGREMIETDDLTIIGEAIRICTDLSGIRVDLLALRPIRELERKEYK